MNRLAYLTIAACASATLVSGCAHVASDMQEFLTRHDPNECETYVYNFMLEAPRLYNERRPDSIQAAVDFIQNECGSPRPVAACEVLLAIEQGRYDDSLLEVRQVEKMLQFRAEEEIIARWGFGWGPYGQDILNERQHVRFAAFRDTLAARALALSAPGSPESAISQFYLREYDAAFLAMQAPGSRGTGLGRQYSQFINRLQDTYKGYGDVNLVGGLWVPDGANKVLGNHPELGFYLGGETKRWRSGFIFSVRFMKAKNPYVVSAKQGVVETRDFYSILLGLDWGPKLIETQHYCADLFVGIGYDPMFSVEEPNDPPSDKVHSALNLGVGVRQRFFLSRSGQYIGIQARYSVTNYPNAGGTDLSGNALTFNLLYGVSTHATLRDGYRRANYQGSWRPQR